MADVVKMHHVLSTRHPYEESRSKPLVPVHTYTYGSGRRVCGSCKHHIILIGTVHCDNTTQCIPVLLCDLQMVHLLMMWRKRQKGISTDNFWVVLHETKPSLPVVSIL